MLGHITQALSRWKEYNPVPEHWTIVELTTSGIREFSARDYYAERLADELATHSHPYLL
jgi:hypothetical protein